LRSGRREILRFLSTTIRAIGERDIARMNELSEVARQGKLTSQEQAELDSYLHVGNLLAVIQSKGRRALQRSSQ
jgi:hypothetical protein